MTPTPGSLWDALIRTPLHRLPPGFQWALWGLGAALSCFPALVQYLAQHRVTWGGIEASMVFGGGILVFYGLFAMPPSLHKVQVWLVTALWVGIVGLVLLSCGFSLWGMIA